MSANTGPWIHLCDAPDCETWGTYGFEWGGKRKWACLAHRERGAAWLAKMKAPAPPADAPKPAQGVLL